MVSLIHTDNHNYRPEFKPPQHLPVINVDLTIVTREDDVFASASAVTVFYKSVKV